MKISSKDLMSLPVLTESGHALGSVSHFDISVDTHMITVYYISSDHLIQRILKWEQDLLITPPQVVSISSEAMIVSDSVLKEADLQKIKISMKQKPGTTGASMISTE